MRAIWRLLPPVCGFTIPVRPQPKRRHDKTGKTPLSTFVFEQEIISPLAQEAWRQPPTIRPVGLIVDLYYFDNIPDESNALKSIEDGMNGVVYVDDEQIAYTEIARMRCTSKSDERAEILILVT